MAMAPMNGYNGVSIVDIRQKGLGRSLIDDICEKLRPGKGKEKKLPTLLLYDERGLQLFEDITYLEEYYLTNAEIEVLTTHAAGIVNSIHEGSIIVELGSGNLRKVNILLRALEKAGKNVDYYALDLSLPELQRTLSAVPKGTFKHVRCHGLLGTYDDGLAWLQASENQQSQKCIIWLGSSLGNLTPLEAADFLKSFSKILGRHDAMLIGVDACQDKDRVYHAYNDKEGITHEFVRNGLNQANRLLGKAVFKQEDWEIVGEYNEANERHQAFYSALKDLEIEDVHITAGERIRVEESYKYSLLQSSQLWQAAGLVPRAVFGNQLNDYHLHLLSVPTFSFPLQAKDYAATAVPTLHEFEQLWAVWDTVTRHMIPKEELLSKPIELRNCCLFYLGHIPAFLDIHLTKATDSIPTDPAIYHQIFERGIDPDVDDPEKCHAHSEIPDTWPPVEEILEFQAQVRRRMRSLYGSNQVNEDRRIGRATWLAFEHEAMHLETLLYMLLQSDKTFPPPGAVPDFEALAKQAEASAIPNEWVKIPSSKLSIGLDDPENEIGPDRYFGWDNEKPKREVEVPAFEAKARPITNEDYARYLDQTDQGKLPASWILLPEKLGFESASEGANKRLNCNGVYMNGHSERLTIAYLNGKSVKTVYGFVPLEYALHWPVLASYDELSGCAEWMNGRIPTADETRSIYHYVDTTKAKEGQSVLSRKISAVNGQMSNEGVEETPPSQHSHNGASSAERNLNPQELFVNLEGCNVGFKHFHPMSVSRNGNKLCGQGEMGGVWEWTSSVLEKHRGFEPMALYPAYTADFFDGKHNIMLGGSWATHPRIAGRKTFVNWYQRNYPFAWAGARLVRDL